MAFRDMITELRGSVPKLPITYCPTLINRAYRTIRESNLWSFQLLDSSWISPPLVTTGTVTVAQGSPAITFDSSATSAINAAQLTSTYSLITQRQFRSSAAGGIYSIIAYNPSTGAATLDRPYADMTFGAGIAYQIYQIYYPAPYADFLVWLSVRNPSMFLDMDLTKTRSEIDALDPQRSWYQFPTCVIPYMIDHRGAGTTNASATLNYQLFELWGQPVSPFTYQCYGVRRGTDLTSPTDTLPIAIPEELVLPRARMFAYEWAEANKDIAPRNVGPDFKFLMQGTAAEFKSLLSKYRKQDKEFCDNWLSNRQITLAGRGYGYYNTLASTAGPYAQY